MSPIVPMCISPLHPRYSHGFLTPQQTAGLAAPGNAPSRSTSSWYGGFRWGKAWESQPFRDIKDWETHGKTHETHRKYGKCEVNEGVRWENHWTKWWVVHSKALNHQRGSPQIVGKRFTWCIHRGDATNESWESRRQYPILWPFKDGQLMTQTNPYSQSSPLMRFKSTSHGHLVASGNFNIAIENCHL